MASKRDQIWAATLREMDVTRSFTATDILQSIPTDKPSRRTVRNTLDAMVELGFLESQGGSGSAPREYHPVKPGTNLKPVGYEARKTSSSAVFPYPGGKSHLSEWIISTMPEHDVYVECFGGSASILASKPRSKYEIINDLSKDIVQFFRVLRNRGDELAEWLASVPYSRSVYETWASEYYDGYRPDDDIERAGRFFSLRFMQFAGVSSTKNGFKVRARRSPARTFSNAKRRVKSLAKRFEDVIIEHKHYKSVLDGYDDSTASVLFYLDPPYEDSQNLYGVGVDYSEMVECLNSLENDWMLSCGQVPNDLEYESVIFRNSRHQIKQSSGDVAEYLVCSFDHTQRTPFTDVANPI